MAPKNLALVAKSEVAPEFQLDTTQVSKATTALTKHVQKTQIVKEEEASKKNLLADADKSDDEETVDEEPVWLLITTKKHVVDKQRLKPGKIPVPHPINSSPTSRVCIITADPQRKYKDAIAHPSFPPDLSSKIGRVLGLTKLKAKYKSYESRRQLLSEYDVFLADDRIITYLPKVLGKIFYKSGAKRPIPVTLTGDQRKPKTPEGQKPRREKGTDPAGEVVGEPKAIARDIERALSSALVHLSPGTSTAIKVGMASWKAESLRENIEALAPAVIEKFIPQKWRNVRSLHIKSASSIALPIWMAEELWVDEQDITDKKIEPPSKAELRQRRKTIEAAKEAMKEEPRVLEEWDDVNEDGVIETKKRKRVDVEEFAKELADRKAKAKKQRQQVMAAAGGVSL